MPFTTLAPCPHDVLGRPCGYFALNCAAPTEFSDASAPSAFCGSLLPDITARNVESALTNPARIVRCGDPAGATNAIPSATLLPVCGLPTDVIDATRSGRTDAT